MAENIAARLPAGRHAGRERRLTAGSRQRPGQLHTATRDESRVVHILGAFWHLQLANEIVSELGHDGFPSRGTKCSCFTCSDLRVVARKNRRVSAKNIAISKRYTRSATICTFLLISWEPDGRADRVYRRAVWAAG